MRNSNVDSVCPRITPKEDELSVFDVIEKKILNCWSPIMSKIYFALGTIQVQLGISRSEKWDA